MVHHPKTIPERCRKKSCPRCRSDQGKFRKIKTDRSRRSTLADHNVDCKILHRRIKDLLHLTIQAVDLIHKQDISLLEIIEDRRHLTRLLDRRTGCYLHMGSHLIGDDPG